MTSSKLKFKNFSDNWEENKFGSLTKKLKSYPISRSFEDENGKYEYIHYGDIHTSDDGIVTKDTKLPSITGDSYETLESGDIILADASEDYNDIAKGIVLENVDKDKIVAGLHTIALNMVNVDSLYFYYLIKTDKFKHFTYKHGVGMKVFGISYNELSKFTVSIPKELEDQKKVGLFLYRIDDLIKKQNKKIENINYMKHGYLQKLFINENNLRLKFKGFSNDLKSFKAREIFSNQSDKNHDNEKVLSVTQDNGLIYRNDLDRDIIYNKNSLKNYKLVKPDNIIISLRSFQGGFEISDKTGLVSPAYTVMNFKDSNYNYNNVYYWKIFFKSYQFIQTLKKVTYGVRDGRSISYKDFSSLSLTVPVLREQRKIGKLMYLIDKQINLEEKKLSQLELLKKGYLQKMFV